MGWTPKVQTKRRKGRATRYTFRVGGKVHDLGMDRKAADRRAAILWAQHLSRQPVGEILYVADLVAAWLRERPARRWTIEAWGKYAGDQLIADLPPDHLEQYARWMTSDGYSAWVVRERINYARAMLRWGDEHGSPSPTLRVPKLPQPVRVPRDIRSSTLREVFEKLPPRAKAILTFVLETGCRPGEACRLLWSDLSEDLTVAILTDHKTASRTGTARRILIPASVVLPKPSPSSPWVFLSRLGRPYTPSGLRSILRKFHVTPYQLRHSFAQHATDSGVGSDDLAALLGHKDSRTTRFYSEIRGQRLRTVLSTLSSPLTPAPDQHGVAASASASASQSPPPPPASDRTP